VNVGTVKYAEKRWGHGRLRQLIVRFYCEFIRGHDYTRWNFDWPYDDPDFWAEIGEPMRDPKPNEELLWIRGCSRQLGNPRLGRGQCGCVQEAWATLLERGGLPGKVTRNVQDNPIRYTSDFGG
jgi:hypothetical protein